jgi:hypothetical protein
MERMPYQRPTTHYDERVKQIDGKICGLIKQRKEISNNNPGYPPFEYISSWAEKFDLYEDMLKSTFASLWNEKAYKPLIEPEGFRKNLPVLKSIEVDNRLFSVICICQYSNSSLVNFNIDWDRTSDSSERQPTHSHFEMFIDGQYDCRMIGAMGGHGHFYHSFVVYPALPDNFSGIELIFKEYTIPFTDKPIGKDIVIRL